MKRGQERKWPRIGRGGHPATIKLSDGSKHIIYDWDGTPPHEMKRARAQYEAWWDALNALAQFLENNLEDHIPHSPRVSRQPWASEEKKVC